MTAPALTAALPAAPSPDPGPRLESTRPSSGLRFDLPVVGPYGFSVSGPHTKGVHVRNPPVNTITFLMGDFEDRGDDLHARAFMSFDLAGLPSDAAVVSARLHVAVALCANDPFVHLGSLLVEPIVFDTIEVPLVRAPASPPPTGPTAVAIEPATPTRGGKSADVTAFVVDALRNRGKRKGLFQVRVRFERELHRDGRANYCGFTSGGALAHDPDRASPHLVVQFE